MTFVEVFNSGAYPAKARVRQLRFTGTGLLTVPSSLGLPLTPSRHLQHHIFSVLKRPCACRKADYFARWVDENVSQLVKRAVLSPDYMKGAWKREVEYQKAFGITPEELLVQSLEPGSHKLPAMAGCHVFPIFPGPAAS